MAHGVIVEVVGVGWRQRRRPCPRLAAATTGHASNSFPEESSRRHCIASKNCAPEYREHPPSACSPFVEIVVSGPAQLSGLAITATTHAGLGLRRNPARAFFHKLSMTPENMKRFYRLRMLQSGLNCQAVTPKILGSNTRNLRAQSPQPPTSEHDKIWAAAPISRQTLCESFARDPDDCVRVVAAKSSALAWCITHFRPSRTRSTATPRSGRCENKSEDLIIAKMSHQTHCRLFHRWRVV